MTEVEIARVEAASRGGVGVHVGRGAAAWNPWRAENGETSELPRAGLPGLNLSGFDLSQADLRQADLGGTNLSQANLSRAHLMTRTSSKRCL
jgi:uncharacterized protein YjbI with pentapeptide repeats